MKKSFSLIEILVSLIIISLLLSAFAPIITKKLKAREITVGSFSNTEGQYITCKEGYHLEDDKCYLDIENCKSYSSGTCIQCKNGYNLLNNTCSAFIENCKTYDDVNCAECKEGYSLYDNKCSLGGTSSCYEAFCAVCSNTSNGNCTYCKKGYSLYNGKCYFGDSKGCTSFKYDDTKKTVICDSCKEGYTQCINGTCKLTTELDKPCPKYSIKIGCLCVMQYNVGDGYYLENFSSVKRCITTSACLVTNGNNTSSVHYNLEPACWTGKTSSSCNANYGGYSGCNRTQCNWTGARVMCENIGWRLPLSSEVSAIINTNPLAELNLCNQDGRNGLSKCAYGNCPGAYRSICWPGNFWASNFTQPNQPVMSTNEHAQWGVGVLPYINNVASVRCVKDL